VGSGGAQLFGRRADLARCSLSGPADAANCSPRMPFLPRGTAAKQRLYAASSCFACTVAFVLLTTVVIPNSGNLDCDALLYHAVNTNNASDLTTAVSVDAKYALSDFFGAADGVPTAAAFSGGGWKAMAQHMGVVRAINELDGFALPTQLASNSGGTWFMCLLAYSPRFFTALEEESGPIENAYTDFMRAYSKLGHVDTMEWGGQGTIQTAMRGLSLLLVAGNYGNSWEKFISAMLDA